MSRRRKKGALRKLLAGSRLGAAERRLVTASVEGFRQRFPSHLPRGLAAALHDTILSLSR